MTAHHQGPGPGTDGPARFRVAALFLVLTPMLLSGCDGGAGGEAASRDAPEIFPRSTPEEVGMSAPGLERAVNEVRGMVERDEVVGAVLLVIRRGRLVLHEAVGFADRETGEEMRVDHIARMRSMTKPLLGTAVLMLVEEGRLTLDDPVHRYLPAFDNDLPGARDITVYHLLTHTSGLTGSIYATVGGTPYGTLREAVDAVGERGPEWLPGTDYWYSDPGSSTLGALVAEVSGTSAEDFIQHRILDPLGMDDSFLNLAPPGHPGRERFASTYQRGDDGSWERYWDRSMEQVVPFFRASGGMYGTAMDYARFMKAMADGGSLGPARLLTPESVEIATRPHTHLQLDPEDAASRRSLYGLHWTVFTDRADPETPGTFGHGGSDGTYAWYDPAEQLLGVWITQSRGSGLAPRFRALVYEAIEERSSR